MTRSSLEALFPTSGLPRYCLRSAEVMFSRVNKSVGRTNAVPTVVIAL